MKIFAVFIEAQDLNTWEKVGAVMTGMRENEDELLSVALLFAKDRWPNHFNHKVYPGTLTEIPLAWCQEVVANQQGC